jgi:hypothetical protein
MSLLIIPHSAALDRQMRDRVILQRRPFPKRSLWGGTMGESIKYQVVMEAGPIIMRMLSLRGNDG